MATLARFRHAGQQCTPMRSRATGELCAVDPGDGAPDGRRPCAPFSGCGRLDMATSDAAMSVLLFPSAHASTILARTATLDDSTEHRPAGHARHRSARSQPRMDPDATPG